MTVALVSPLLRIVSSSSSSSSSSIVSRLQRFVLYVWIVVITLHNISIVSNSALNPSLYIITTATITTTTNNHIYQKTHHKRKNMFRTVLSSSNHGASEKSLELLPLNPVSLTTESSVLQAQQQQQQLLTLNTKASLDDDNDDDDNESSPSKSRALNEKQLRSPLRTRFGLFRRKLMMEDTMDVENFDTTASPPPPPPSSGGTILAAAAAIIPGKSKLTIGSLFRGGATTATSTVVGSSDTGHNYFITSVHGVVMILSKLFHTIFVQNFCHFANFVGTTKARCFCLLIFSVIVESYATTLSKQAKDTGNALLFARACLVYLFW